MPNPIVTENALPGSPQNEWFPSGLPNASIRGFTDSISYNKGESVVFYVQTPDVPYVAYDIVIYRLGHYGGNGARRIAHFSGVSIEQPPPKRTSARSLDEETNARCFPYLIECSNWYPAWTWRSFPDLASGLFMAKLTRRDTAVSSSIFFVIRDDERNSDILVQTSDTTWNAYSSGPSYQGGAIPAGRIMEGRSLYDVNKARAFKVSYLRPHVFETTDTLATGKNFCDDIARNLIFYYGNEYSLIRFLEGNGYDVSYFSGRDADLRGDLIRNHKLFVTNGHDEYWSGRQMDNILAARDAGVHLAFFTGNTAYWKIRWEDNHRTLVCYKELSPLKLDPEPGVTTGTFRDQGFASPEYDGYRPENKLTGLLTSISAPMKFDLHVPESDGKLRFWRNTSVARMEARQTRIFQNLLGFEIDGDVDNGARPDGLFHLSSTEVLGQPPNRFEHGLTSTTHNMTLYRHAPSGAFVFHAGTIHLQRALAGFYEGKEQGAEADLQQAIVNLFADMGVQPGTLQVGLSCADATADRTGPTVQVLDPGDGTIVKLFDTVVVSGTASDEEGRVAAVEVSMDDARTWRRAVGREFWYFAFTPCREGAMSIHVRGVDDSGNIGREIVRRNFQVQRAKMDDFVRNGQFSCGFAKRPQAARWPGGGTAAPGLARLASPNSPDGAGQGLELGMPAHPMNEGLIGFGWSALRSSEDEPALSNAGMIAGVNIQRVAALSAGDGIYQDLTLIPERWYILVARIFVEVGAVALKIGTRGTLADPTFATTDLVGRWHWLNLTYRPAQADTTFVICSHLGPATFKIDEVALRAG